MHGRFVFFAIQRQASDIEQEMEERKIRKRSIRLRNEPRFVEFVDQHHPTQSINYVHGDSRD